jgi:hypothetical protein
MKKARGGRLGGEWMSIFFTDCKECKMDEALNPKGGPQYDCGVPDHALT